MNDNEKTMYSNLFYVVNNDAVLKNKYLLMVKSILKQISEQYIQNILGIYPDFFETFSRVSSINDEVAVSRLFDWKSPLFQEIIHKEWKASVFGNIYHAPSTILVSEDIMVRNPSIKSDKNVLFSPYMDLDKINLNKMLSESEHKTPLVLYADDNYAITIDYIYNYHPNQPKERHPQHEATPTVKINILSRSVDGFVMKSKYSLKQFSDFCKKIPDHPMATVADALGFVFTGKES